MSELSEKQKNAIENLIVVSSYVGETSIISDRDQTLLDRSIKVCEELIGRQVINQEDDSQINEVAEILINRINKK